MNSIPAAFKPDSSSGEGPKQQGNIPSLKLNDGHEIPMFAYGLGTARSRDAADNVIRLTGKAIENGYHHLDCAESYKNEKELGTAIAKSGVDRSHLFVTTKLQNPGRGEVEADFSASLSRLGLEYVDLYLIHSPFGCTPAQLQAAWGVLEAIQASGRARSIGVSNFSVADLKAVLETARVTPAINQIEFHPYLQHEPDGLLDFCREHGIAVSAYGALAAVSGRAGPDGGPVDEIHTRLAKKYGVTEADVALRWCLDQGIVVITTTSNEQRLETYIRKIPAFKLTPAEVSEITELGKKKHFRGYWTKVFAEDDRR